MSHSWGLFSEKRNKFTCEGPGSTRSDDPKQHNPIYNDDAN